MDVDSMLATMQAFAISAVTALIIFILGKWVARIVAKVIKKIMIKRSVDEALVEFSYSLIHWALLAFVVIAALGQLGIQTASFVAIVGAAGLAIGLALQGSLANFAAGVLILIFRPFRIGDFIEVAGESGVVEKIHIFTTELHTPDNKLVIIPNGGITAGNIVNYSAKPTRRVDLVMGVSYIDDIDKVRDVLKDEISKESRILKDPAPVVAVSELADNSVNFVVRPWVNAADYWGVYWDLTESIKKRFDAEGISIPFPQQDVYMHAVEKK